MKKHNIYTGWRQGVQTSHYIFTTGTYYAQNWVTLNLIEILCVNALLLPDILTVSDLTDLYSGYRFLH